MPNYDFRCLDCHKRFVVYLSYIQYGNEPVYCTFCGSEHVQRRIGRIRTLRSEESRLDDLSSMDDLSGLEDNPRELGRMLRKMGAEVGEDIGPEFQEVVGRLEAGESPEEIEKSIPDLGGGDAMDDFGAGAVPGDLDDF